MVHQIDPDRLEVVDSRARQRFEVALGDQIAVLTYQEEPGLIVLNHAEVPPDYRGLGIADKMARAALEYARRSGLKVVPYCSFVAAYIRRHPEYQSLVASR